MEHFDPSVTHELCEPFIIKLFWRGDECFCVDLSGDFMLLEAPTMKHKLCFGVRSDNEHDVVAEEHHIDRILDRCN